MSSRRLLFLIEPCYHGEQYVSAGQALGLDVAVIRRKGGPPNPDPAGTFELLVDRVDTTSVLRSVISVSQGREIGILPGNEYCVPVAAASAEFLGVRGNPHSAALACRDKALMRFACRDLNIKSPRSVSCNDMRGAAQAVEEIGFPVVVKPVAMASSINVRRISNSHELKDHIRSIEDYPNLIDYPPDSAFVVEEFVEGPEFSVELLMQRGNCIWSSTTSKEKGPLPYFVELGHVVPALDLSVNETVELTGAAIELSRGLGINYGPCHVEIRLTESGPVLMEIAARMPGDRIPELIWHAYGVDLYREAIAQLFDEVPPPTKTAKSAAAIRFVRKLPIPGVDRESGVVEIEITGRERVEIRSSEDRCGHVIAVGLTPEEARDRARVAADAIECRVGQ